MRVGVRGPTQRISTRNSTDNARWGTGPTQRISTRNSTDNARWGTGQHREFQQEILQAMRVGVRAPT